MKRLSIIVPVYNEEAQLARVIERLLKVSLPMEVEWIFVDDRSQDRSLEILKECSRRWGFRVLEQPKNVGKGAAIIRGISEAQGDYILIQDADFEYSIEDVPSLLEPLLQGKADVVYGSRFKKNAPQVHRTYHYFVNRFLTMLSNLFSGIYLTDMETCYKIFDAQLIKSMCLRSKRFGIEVELTAYLAKSRARIYELPISYFPRTRLQGKKINWKDGVAAIFHIFYFNYCVSEEKAFSGLPERYRTQLNGKPVHG